MLCMGKNGAAGLGFYTKRSSCTSGIPFGFAVLLDGIFVSLRGIIFDERWEA